MIGFSIYNTRARAWIRTRAFCLSIYKFGYDLGNQPTNQPTKPTNQPKETDPTNIQASM
jgi:hypothetical protein